MHPKPLVIGIAGGSGSGKTLLAQSLRRALLPRQTLIISQDSYYKTLPSEHAGDPEAYNFDHPGALDWELLKKQLDELKAGRAVRVPRYCFVTHSRTDYSTVAAAEILIVEGTLILHDPDTAGRMDLRIYLNVDADIRLLRRIVRDVRERGRSIESVIRQYLHTVRPMYLQFIGPSRKQADMVLTDAPVEEWTACVTERLRSLRSP